MSTAGGRAPQSTARGVLRPTSLAVIVAFAAVGAALPFAFDRGAVAGVRPGAGAAHVAVARHASGSGSEGSGAPPNPGDQPGEVVAAPVSASGYDVSSAVLAATAATDAAAAAPVPAREPAPVAPSAPHQPAPQSPPSPSPNPGTTAQLPTPAGTVSITVSGPVTGPSSVTLTAPGAGSTTVGNPLPLP